MSTGETSAAIHQQLSTTRSTGDIKSAGRNEDVIRLRQYPSSDSSSAALVRKTTSEDQSATSRRGSPRAAVAHRTTRDSTKSITATHSAPETAATAAAATVAGVRLVEPIFVEGQSPSSVGDQASSARPLPLPVRKSDASCASQWSSGGDEMPSETVDASRSSAHRYGDGGHRRQRSRDDGDIFSDTEQQCTSPKRLLVVDSDIASLTPTTAKSTNVDLKRPDDPDTRRSRITGHNDDDIWAAEFEAKHSAIRPKTLGSKNDGGELSVASRHIKSEGQTPTSNDDRSRVSKKSSQDLDQLRLQFQQQKIDSRRFKSELDDLKKMLVDAQRRFSSEREGRRQLEEWTDYLERELETYLKSRKYVEKRYVKLLEAAKDVDNFTQFVIGKYNELHRQLEETSGADESDSQRQLVYSDYERRLEQELRTVAASRLHLDTSPSADAEPQCRDSDSFERLERTVSCVETSRQRATPLGRSFSSTASCNPSRRLEGPSNQSNSAARTANNSNGGDDRSVTGASTKKSGTDATETSERKLSDDEVEDDLRRTLSAGQFIAATFANSEPGLTTLDRRGSAGRRRRKANSNASTQTLATVDEVDDSAAADSDDDGGGRARSRRVDETTSTDEAGGDRTEAETEDEQRRRQQRQDKDDIQSRVLDVLRLMLAPVFSAERTAVASRSVEPTAHDPYWHQHYRNQPHHHHYQHQHHHHHHQQLTPNAQHYHHYQHQHQQQQQQQRPQRASSGSDVYSLRRTGSGSGGGSGGGGGQEMQPARPVHSHLTGCASCNMRRANFRDAVSFNVSSNQWRSSQRQHDGCPRCTKALRAASLARVGLRQPTGAVVSSTRFPPTLRAVSPTPPSPLPPSTSRPTTPAAGPSPRAPDTSTVEPSDDQKAADELLRQRIERLLVEMSSKAQDEKDAKATEMLREAILNSATFPTLFSN